MQNSIVLASPFERSDYLEVSMLIPINPKPEADSLEGLINFLKGRLSNRALLSVPEKVPLYRQALKTTQLAITCDARLYSDKGMSQVEDKLILKLVFPNNESKLFFRAHVDELLKAVL